MNIYTVNGSSIVARDQGHAVNLYCDARPNYVGPLKTRYLRSADIPRVAKIEPVNLKGWRLVGADFPLRRRIASPIH